MKKYALLLILAAACESRPGGDLGPTATATTPKALVAHEWGTYTSVQGSTGETMIGLHHTEEPLPAFVHGRGDDPHKKMVEAIPEPINQKLETPVIYFYAQAPKAVHIEVDFPKGIISEWYPNAGAFSPPIGSLTRIAQGTMSWDASLSPGTMQIPAVPSDSVWAPSRNVRSSGLRAGGEDEGFIFYRGLGRFEMPFHVSAAAGGKLMLTNGSDQEIAAAFLLSIDGSGGAVQEIGAVPAQGSTAVTQTLSREPLESYVALASSKVAGALERSGLSNEEARAMVDTWSRSYFRNPGLRVLYIAPRAWTDALLPIRITPTPDELVRTLVGRVEVMTPEEESRIVSDVVAGAAKGPPVPPDAYGRFTEPKLRRALELIDDPGTKAYAQSLVDAAFVAP